MFNKKQLLVLSAHEGSGSWQKTIKLINNKNIICKQISILQDEDYRTSSKLEKSIIGFLYTFSMYFIFLAI